MDVDTIGYVQGWGYPFGLGQPAGEFEVKAQGEILEVGRARQTRTITETTRGANGSHYVLPQTVLVCNCLSTPSVRCNIGDGELPCQI